MCAIWLLLWITFIHTNKTQKQNYEEKKLRPFASTAYHIYIWIEWIQNVLYFSRFNFRPRVYIYIYVCFFFYKKMRSNLVAVIVGFPLYSIRDYFFALLFCWFGFWFLALACTNACYAVTLIVSKKSTMHCAYALK